MKKHLVIYGTEEFSGTIELLKDSVCDYIDQIHVYNRNDIDFNFYNKNRTILDSPRGNGYWIWKPYFILKTFEKINNNDFCLYLDAGMTAIRDINILFELCKINDGILLFENKNANVNNEVWLNYMWTKYDCFYLMNCIEDKYIYGKQVDAAFQVYQKNEKSINILNEYLKYCENENVVTDNYNILGENYNGFVDHRHDQSILSLLAIKYDLKLEHNPSHWGMNSLNKKFKTLFYHHKRRMQFNEIFPNKL